MIVVDASALADVLLRVRTAPLVEERILDAAEALHAPQLLDLELLQVLRRFAAMGAWQRQRAAEALSDLEALRIARHPHEPLRRRVWELRANLTAYEGAYVALAEHLACPLVTRDARLAKAPGHHARVEVL